MKSPRNLIIGLILVIAGVAGLMTTGGTCPSMGNMMGGGMMGIQQPIDKARYKDLDTAAGKSFTTTCSQCHAAPDPRQHTAKEWPAVVQRMIRNMERLGKPVPDQATLNTILGFLQKHAR